MTSSPMTRLLTLASSVSVVAACAGSDRPADQAAAAPAPVQPNVVEVTANDYAFTLPDTLPGGPTTFRLVNQGKEFHHLVLVKLPEGMTPEDFARAPVDGPPSPGAHMLGGPNPAAPAGSAEATVDLAPGQYTLICVIPSPDGKMHMAKGMVRGLVVTAATTTAVVPAPDVTVALKDYDFEFSTPLTPGRRVIRIENLAEQPHELVLFKLDAGKSLQDMLAFLEKLEGVPPGRALNGSSPMSRGVVNTVVVDVRPGDYALICFVPDAKDGKPHLAHGMAKQLTVQ